MLRVIFLPVIVIVAAAVFFMIERPVIRPGGTWYEDRD